MAGAAFFAALTAPFGAGFDAGFAGAFAVGFEAAFDGFFTGRAFSHFAGLTVVLGDAFAARSVLDSADFLPESESGAFCTSVNRVWSPIV